MRSDILDALASSFTAALQRYGWPTLLLTFALLLVIVWALGHALDRVPRHG